MEDTIVAIATPTGQGAVSLIRISGNESTQVANKVFKCNKLDWLSVPRTQYFGGIYNSKDEKVDSVLTTFFKRPHSYTGDDVIEIACHGGMLMTF